LIGAYDPIFIGDGTGLAIYGSFVWHLAWRLKHFIHKRFVEKHRCCRPEPPMRGRG
jgi:hypothetical protein